MLLGYTYYIFYFGLTKASFSKGGRIEAFFLNCTLYFGAMLLATGLVLISSENDYIYFFDNYSEQFFTSFIVVPLLLNLFFLFPYEPLNYQLKISKRKLQIIAVLQWLLVFYMPIQGFYLIIKSVVE